MLHRLRRAAVATRPLLALFLSFALPLVPAAARAAPDWVRIAERVDAAVVEIATLERTPGVDPAGNVRVTSQGGLGSGALVSSDGLVLTAAHVVATADLVAVQFRGAAPVRARVIAASPADDVALLRLEGPVPAGIAPLPVGDSAAVRRGEPVMVIGAPYGIGHSVSVGVISGRHAAGAGVAGAGAAGGAFETELLQTDAAINQGNSGGPMFNARGEVVGVVSHILSRSGGFDGIGFAVGTNTARRVLIDEPAFWSGATTVLVVGEVAAALQAPQAAALLVQRVPAESPAARFGLRGGGLPATVAGRPVLLGGDLILAVDGVEIVEDPVAMRALQERLRDRPAGSVPKVRVLRGGRVVELGGSPGTGGGSR